MTARRIEHLLLVLTLAGVKAWFLGKGHYDDARRRSARVVDAMHRHPAGNALRIGQAAAARVQRHHGLTAWVQCVLCGHRFLAEGLLPDELRDCLDNPSPTCPRCVDVLVATEKDLAQ